MAKGDWSSDVCSSDLHQEVGMLMNHLCLQLEPNGGTRMYACEVTGEERRLERDSMKTKERDIIKFNKAGGGS